MKIDVVTGLGSAMSKQETAIRKLFGNGILVPALPLQELHKMALDLPSSDLEITISAGYFTQKQQRDYTKN